MSKNAWYPPGSSTASSITANQGTPNTNANAWPVKVTDGTDVVAVNADGSLNVQVTGGLANPLPVTDSPQTAVLQAFSDKTAGALVPEAYDYLDITYVGATTDINTVVFKSGGAGGTTVATLTMGYDGSNRLNSVTRS